MAKRKVRKALRRNPAATTTASAGVIVIAILQLLNIELTPEQTTALIAVIAAIPAFINWLKTQWTWLQNVVKSGEAVD